MASTWKRIAKLFIAILNTSVFAMILVTTVNTSWIEKETALGRYHQGLWQSCMADVCMALDSPGSTFKIESINIVRVTIIIGALFSFLACVLSIKVALKFVAITSAISCCFVATAMGIYTNDTKRRISISSGYQYDWAYVLGWICSTTGFIATIATGVVECLLMRNAHEEILQ